MKLSSFFAISIVTIYTHCLISFINFEKYVMLCYLFLRFKIKWFSSFLTTSPPHCPQYNRRPLLGRNLLVENHWIVENCESVKIPDYNIQELPTWKWKIPPQQNTLQSSSLSRQYCSIGYTHIGFAHWLHCKLYQIQWFTLPTNPGTL